MVKSYVPERADVVWLDFEPQAGREQAGRRPALVISPKIYNQKAGLALMCPITSQIKGYPFEQLIKSDKIQGVVLVDQLRSLDWRVRNASFIMRVGESTLKQVHDKIIKLVLGV